MSKHESQSISGEEIKKEFQLERMILFSDAVFAIVITLMAIEIRIPETEAHMTPELLSGMLLHVLPTVLAYSVSFIFIGAIWYQHLKIFSILKDYDKGLVIRNLFLLFFVGLFPFSASLLTRAKGIPIAVFIYMGIIMFCILAQYLLYHYIVVKRPAFCFNADMTEHKLELRKRKFSLIAFGIAGALVIITYTLIEDPLLKPMSTFWMVLFPIIYRLYSRKKKK